MFVRMCWEEAKEKFDAHEDFPITCGKYSHPYNPCYYTRDYHIGKAEFIRVLEALSIYEDASVHCWKQVPEGKKEAEDGKVFRMTVWDKKEEHLATAYMRASNADAARQEAHDRCYKVMGIEEV